MDYRKMGFLCLFCLFINTLSFAQIRIVYEVNFLNVSKDKNVLDSPYYKKVVQPMLDIFDTSQGVLKICKDKSYFSIVPEDLDQSENNILADAYIGTTKWISTAKESMNINSRNALLIVPDYNLEEWQILGEKKIIAGYECVKAIKEFKYQTADQKKHNRTCEVWFSTELPFLEGFMDANNLPGVILAYNDGIWDFTAQKVEKAEDCEIKIPKFKKISYSESLGLLKRKKYKEY